MGSTKQTETQQSTQTTTPQPTAEERELNKLHLEREKFLDPQIRGVQSQGLTLTDLLLRGQNLPGYLQNLPGGISPEVTQNIVNQSLRDVNTQLAASGAGTFLESGASQSIGARTAGDIRNQAEQFNIQNLQQLLNIAVGGQAQVQQPILGYSSLLSNRLSGLRPTTTTGSGSSSGKTQYSFFTSPFTTSLAGGVGQGLGAGAGAALFGCWVASEIFGGWNEPKTIASRIYINLIAPEWFKNAYLKFGEKIAQFIKDKSWIKSMIRPLFEYFAKRGGYASS